MPKLSPLQYISSGVTYADQLRQVQQALDYGADWIQLRWKEGTPKALIQLAEELRILTRNYKARLIINDKLELAEFVDADGLHLGLNDGAIAEARKKLGAHKIIGGTANTLAHVKQRIAENCDYIGLGPLRFTSTKRQLSPVLGLIGYRSIFQGLQQCSISSPPVYAIGGICASDLIPLLQTGVYGVAVSSIINEDPNCIQIIKKNYDKYLTDSQ
ncbi:MAG TPA: thiamine phosphate synthase [Candidatus Sphingobacterium stercorigallinarum]|nr:thiamine phosphate synthase [Candidatus Sphingobacterium stercorigallinarum]